MTDSKGKNKTNDDYRCIFIKLLQWPRTNSEKFTELICTFELTTATIYISLENRMNCVKIERINYPSKINNDELCINESRCWKHKKRLSFRNEHKTKKKSFDHFKFYGEFHFFLWKFPLKGGSKINKKKLVVFLRPKKPPTFLLFIILFIIEIV